MLNLTLLLSTLTLTIADEQAEALLKQHKIKTDRDSLSKFMQSYCDGNAPPEIVAWIEDLGGKSYSVRERASAELRNMRISALPLVKRAADSDDLEVRYRARKLLELFEKGESQRAQLLHAMFTVIEKKKLSGLAGHVIRMFPFCEATFVQRQAQKALGATSTPEDIKLLKGAAVNKMQPLAVAAVRALGALDADAAKDAVIETLKSDRDSLRVVAAEILAMRANRNCLKPLAELLNSSDVDVRTRANHILRALTGKKIVFTAYAKEEERKGPVSEWKSWIENEGVKAELKHPLNLDNILLGRILVCVQSQNRIYELDSTGKVVWEKKNFTRPWGCQGLPNGHRLVGSYTSRMVQEFDAAGKVVWSKTGLPGGITSVQRLGNGNTLVACTDAQKILEIDRAGKITWTAAVSGRPFFAQRLDNGRTLVTLHGNKKVVEVDRTGKIVWSANFKLSNPQSARRLENGNTLVTDYSTRRVIEMNREGKVIWETTANRVYDAQRLPNGTTLVVDITGVKKISPGKKVIWEHRVSGAVRAVAY
jgi:hypothetical protein